MYEYKEKKWVEGEVTQKGILCDCHEKNLSLADFETHSESSTANPLQNIILKPKTSLLKCLSFSWIGYGEDVSLGSQRVDVDGDSRKDETCTICGYGGDLMCCASCPTSMHQECLNIQEIASGDWNCVYCLCKFCRMAGESTLKENQNRDSSVPTLPTCNLCKQKYHLLCAQEKDTSQNKHNATTFCSQNCQKISEQLKMILGAKQQMGREFSWTLLKHSEDNLEISTISGAKNVECNAKLAVAWSIIDENFERLIDQSSGINMIHNIVYSCGSNIKRIDYTGFFTAILEKGDEIVCAATLRIHGNLLAEMPFVATHKRYRRQGMCRRLINGIEKVLSFLNVEKLVLPAIPQKRITWTQGFGFKPLEESQKEDMKCFNIVTFPETEILQKPVPKKMRGAGKLSFSTGI